MYVTNAQLFFLLLFYLSMTPANRIRFRHRDGVDWRSCHHDWLTSYLHCGCCYTSIRLGLRLILSDVFRTLYLRLMRCGTERVTLRWMWRCGNDEGETWCGVSIREPAPGICEPRANPMSISPGGKQCDADLTVKLWTLHSPCILSNPTQNSYSYNFLSRLLIFTTHAVHTPRANRSRATSQVHEHPIFRIPFSKGKGPLSSPTTRTPSPRSAVWAWGI
jgi:hypothetical protein